ncbi:MAG: hypothetical protein AB9869_11815 [Verrucomicrobiia bacterium]
MFTETRSFQDWQHSAIREYNYEYRVVDPVTKATCLLRTRRPKIQEQVEFIVRQALSETGRPPAGGKAVYYAF